MRHARWRELDSVASTLGAALGTARRTVAALESARQVLDDERDDARRRLDSLKTKRDGRPRARVHHLPAGEAHDRRRTRGGPG